MRLPYFDPIGPFQKSTPFERGDWFVPTGGMDELVEKEYAHERRLRIVKIVTTVLVLAAFLVAGTMVVADDFVKPSAPSPFAGSMFR